MILLLQLALAIASGWLGYISYEPIGFWPGGILAITGLYLALALTPNRLLRGGVLAGLHGLVMYLFALPWIGELVGAGPYIALACACALYAIVTGFAGTALSQWRYGFLLFPLLYVAVEHLRSSFPFGGFAWVRLAWGQIDGPLANLAPIGGAALVTTVTALVGTSIAALILQPRRAGALGLIIPLGVAVIAGVSIDRGSPIGEVKVAAIQGNVPRLGLDFNAQRRAVLNNHIRVTKELDQPVDLVFWPENSSDVNPFNDPQAMDGILSAVESAGAPVLVGTITADDRGYYNTMQVFDPETGAGDYHRKVYLQPFGEYMPYREFFSRFSDYVDLAGNFSPGEGDFTVKMRGVTVGVATCFEVIVDDAYRTAVRHGAEILTTPTNNATFGFSDMTYQQLAMSRFRAKEFDRAVVVAATSGVSAIIHPDGKVSQQSEIFSPASLVEELPLKTSQTLSARFGAVIEWVLTIMGVIFSCMAVLSIRKRKIRK